jgi:hypothetical protein
VYRRIHDQLSTIHLPWTCLCVVTRFVSKKSSEVQFFFIHEGNKTALILSVSVRLYTKCDISEEMILDCGRPGRIRKINYSCRSFVIGTVLSLLDDYMRQQSKDSFYISRGDTRFSSSTSAGKPKVDILRKRDIGGEIILKLISLDTIDWPML